MRLRTLLLMLSLVFPALRILAGQPYTIWPTPHNISATGQNVKKPGKVTVVAGPDIDAVTVSRAQEILAEHAIKSAVAESMPEEGAVLLLGVNGRNDAADGLATRWSLPRDVFNKPKYDRHLLSLRSEEGRWRMVILGENTDAVFCGLASLEQMLDEVKRAMPTVDIVDYADIRDRGIIEGYYGVPYTKEVTEDLFRFMARYKMNTYMYGAKSDPYHSKAWDQPYPTTITEAQREIGYMTAGMMQSMVEVAHKCKVNFIWAIHPGTAFVDPAQPNVLERIMSKFQAMHNLGLRQFGVFVDDCGVPDDTASLNLAARRLTELQHLVDNRWNKPGTNAADTVKALNYVPQLYAYSWVKRDKAERFFQSLSSTPQKTNIYITGAAVWTVPNTHDPALVKSWLGRDVAWWWNYPCNDNDVTKLFMADTYKNFADEAWIDSKARLSADMQGVKTLICNPMQQGEGSKVALFSVADYSWNMSSFDNMKAWQAASDAIFGSRLSPYFQDAVDNLRYFDGESALAAAIRTWRANTAEAQPLLDELKKVNRATVALAKLGESASVSDRLMWEDIRPWVIKLRDMTEWSADLVEARSKSGAPIDGKQLKGKAAVAFKKASGIDVDPAYQFKILTGMGSDIKLVLRQAEPSAKVLRPFLKELLTGKI